jgi:hypothetical protein
MAALGVANLVRMALRRRDASVVEERS